jgi:hypothetical protein
VSSGLQVSLLADLKESIIDDDNGWIVFLSTSKPVCDPKLPTRHRTQILGKNIITE